MKWDRILLLAHLQHLVKERTYQVSMTTAKISLFHMSNAVQFPESPVQHQQH